MGWKVSLFCSLTGTRRNPQSKCWQTQDTLKWSPMGVWRFSHQTSRRSVVKKGHTSYRMMTTKSMDWTGVNGNSHSNWNKRNSIRDFQQRFPGMGFVFCSQNRNDFFFNTQCNPCLIRLPRSRSVSHHATFLPTGPLSEETQNGCEEDLVSSVVIMFWVQTKFSSRSLAYVPLSFLAWFLLEF